MKRYFFDRVSETRTEFDYRGCEFATLESAAEMAELMAVDLSIDCTSEWQGWTIKVSNVLGVNLLTVPVQECDLGD